MSQFDLLNTLPSGEKSTGDRFFGVTIGIVTNNQDPDKLGRIKVKFPWLSDTEESAWARVVTPMAGKARGLYCLPEVDDEVLLSFEQGKMAFPYVMGALWNGKDTPPIDNDDGKNNLRGFTSRSGHTVVFDDTEGEENILISDKSQKNRVKIDTKTNTITLTAEKDLVLEAQGNISLNSQGDVEIAANNINLTAKQNYTAKANSQGSLEASSGLAIKCMAGVKINDGALEVT